MNAQLNAAQSYWTARRDEAAANLDILLNKPTYLSNPQIEINELLRQFAEASNVLSTINLILNQQPEQTQPTTTQNPS